MNNDAFQRFVGTDSMRPFSTSRRHCLTRLSASIHTNDGRLVALIPARWWNSVRTQPGSSVVTVTPVPLSSNARPVDQVRVQALMAE